MDNNAEETAVESVYIIHVWEHLNRKFPCVLKNPKTEEIKWRALFEQLQTDHENLKNILQNKAK